MTQFANFDDEHVPNPHPHRDRYPRMHANASGRTVVSVGKPGTGAWLAADTTVDVRR